jgi:hypothetical protein
VRGGGGGGSGNGSSGGGEAPSPDASSGAASSGGTSSGAASGDAAAPGGDDGSSAGDDAGSGSDASSDAASAEAGADAASTRDGGPVARPGYNHGTGFFVTNGKLYDANGVEFRIRGVDKLHWDNGSPGLASSHANTVRWTIDFTRAASDNIGVLQGGAGKTPGGIYSHMVVMPGAWDAPAGTLTCSSDTSALGSAVDTWVAQASSWTSIERYSILNLANEWGPSDSTVWRDSYITAIGRMRAAGYHATLSITSGGCGQDNADLVKYAKAVFDSDPEKNVIFDRHVYGGDADVNALKTDAAALAALGVPVIFGEFGPGRGIGPSPTDLTPAQVIQTAEDNAFGWLAWAWDDNDQANAEADNGWFALSYAGAYAKSADLTIFGQEVIEGCTNAAPGGCGCPDTPVPADSVIAPGCQGTPTPHHSANALATLATPATIF